MRPRTEIEKDGARKDILLLEVALDNRDLLVKLLKQGVNKNKKEENKQ